jgi:hypothetical protein
MTSILNELNGLKKTQEKQQEQFQKQQKQSESRQKELEKWGKEVEARRVVDRAHIDALQKDQSNSMKVEKVSYLTQSLFMFKPTTPVSDCKTKFLRWRLS